MRTFRPLLSALLLVGVAGVVIAAESLDERIAQIERINRTQPWEASAALIEALGPDRTQLSEAQRFRVELIESRNLALKGDYERGLKLAQSLLQRDVPPELRIRALTLAVNISVNVSDYPGAFGWLEEGLTLLDRIQAPQPRLLGMASYLYLRVGEERAALAYARQALEVAHGTGDPRDECLALSDLAIALDLTGNPGEAESMSRAQIAACDRAGDPVFRADGYKGVGKVLVAQELYAQAIPWLEQARRQFQAAGFTSGYLETGVTLGRALLNSGAPLRRARALVDEALPVFEQQQARDNIETARTLLAQILAREGNAAGALEQLQLARIAHNELDEIARERRLAWLQMKFDTQAKEQRIAELQGERELQAAELEARSRAQWLQGLGLLALLLVSALLLSLLARAVGERRRFRELSERDGLTGLRNHQSALRAGHSLLLRCRRDGRRLTAIVADIDYFKQINDRHGHAAGDEVLRRLGKLLLEVFPKRAVVGRSGGEEFTMLVDGAVEQARYLVEDLRRRIAPFEFEQRRIDYSLSYGLCEADPDATLETVLRSADMALYEAKRNGRNRVVDAAAASLCARSEPGLVVVGSGIQLGRHLSQRGLSEIQEAERVLVLTDGAAHAMIAELRPDLIDLRVHYAPGKDRRQTYREMEAAIMAEVLAGKRVCVVFYGHPGVFADVPHAVVRKVREAGLSARMEPGISSEACLYADLGIDPGRHGVQSLEATQFLLEEREIDTRSLLLLWQVALTGDTACVRFHAEPQELQRLVERLQRDYPPEHEVILYEAARLPVEPFRAERMPLRDLARAHYEEYTMLVVPACAPRPSNLAARLLQVARTGG
ncbi:MAG: diguanylate cyclase [Xanthomonadales bacterium]|nr:hypothetical protein [Xanthomonadales bacterium]MCC6592931.1 diguanylate cyclase [Xanthomonadales bacterium]